MITLEIIEVEAHKWLAGPEAFDLNASYNADHRPRGNDAIAGKLSGRVGVFVGYALYGY